MVTYRRPEDLRTSLVTIQGQSKQPDTLLVVDNGSEASVRVVAQAAGVDYVDAQKNLGPAGGLALGMRWVLERADDVDWMLLLDDDDPPVGSDEIESSWRLATERAVAQYNSGGRIGAVGVTGADYQRRTGSVRRLDDDELCGLVDVDHIGGGMLPMYSVEAVRRVGVMDSDLFFGFEELEYGLRLRRAGYRLVVDGDRWLARRVKQLRAGLKRRDLRTPIATVAWRRYYGVRNLVLIAKRHGTWTGVLSVSVLGSARGVLQMLRARRPLAEVALPLLGAADGLLGRSGRRINPSSADAVVGQEDR